MKIRWSIFPKFFGQLTVEELAALVRDAGLDTTNVVIRNGFPVTRENMKTALPDFVRRMRQEGIDVHFATAGFMPAEILADESLLAIPAEAGIREFRMGYFNWDKSKTPGDCADAARRQMEQLVPYLEKHRLRAVYQVHHGTLFPGAWSVWPWVRHMPPEFVGIMLDPGNQLNEGWERWETACHLLGRSLVAMGAKDGLRATRERPFAWTPCGQGDVDWRAVVRALKSVDFDGTLVFMPFYNADELALMRVRLKDEVAAVRAIVAAVREEDR